MHNYSRGAEKWLYQETLIDMMRLAVNYKLGDHADVAKLMDSSASGDSVRYIEEIMFAKEQFPVLLSIYFYGPDHGAHHLGMETYGKFIKENTDEGIRKLVKALKDAGEFENKIFIIVSDHGMTAMPTNLKFKKSLTVLDAEGNEHAQELISPAEMSCELKLNFQIDPLNPDAGKNNRKAELANNNLHIWELADVLKGLQKKKKELSYRVLAPSKIRVLFVHSPAGARSNLEVEPGITDFANVVAAFNGPMAHIYLRGKDGWDMPPTEEELKRFAQVLRVLYQIEDPEEAESTLRLDLTEYFGLLENNVGRLMKSVDKILIRIGGNYYLFSGYETPDPLALTDEYVKAAERIRRFNHLDRSGDIILIMRDKTSENAEMRYTTGSACKAWHGSLSPSDSYVPLILTYPGGNKSEIEPIINKTEGCNTELCEGNWKVTDLIKTFVKTQYGTE